VDQKHFASLGGKARAGKLSKQRRSEIAKQAGVARWAAHRKQKNETRDLPKSL
jgi:hypothetical protein